MLSYTFHILNEEKYHDIAAEEFDYTADLLAAILSKGLASQLKRGLGKDYIQRADTLASPYGKINISSSIKERAILSCKLVCTFDSYEENTYMNQVLKSTVLALLLSEDVKKERKRTLKKLLIFFENVDTTDIRKVAWNQFHYTCNSVTYKMLINMCYLVARGLLLTDENGKLCMSKYLDDRQLYVLFEKFILEYFRKHFPEFNPKPSKIEWALDDEIHDLLPMMKSDVTLNYYGKTVIIDAKFYTRMLQYNQLFNSKTIHSNNLYQIFTYVKNADKKNDGSVSGVLLYAKTNEESLNQSYLMSGNKICVKSLDLNSDFENVRRTLDSVAELLI